MVVVEVGTVVEICTVIEVGTVIEVDNPLEVDLGEVTDVDNSRYDSDNTAIITKTIMISFLVTFNYK